MIRLVAVLAACGVGNALNLSIYDTMMKLNNLQYLQPLPPRWQTSQRS